MRFVVVYTESAVFTKILTHEYTLDHQSLSVCEVSDKYLLGCLRYTEKHRKDILIICGCLLLFINIKFRCKHGGDGVSTWEKFDSRM